MTAAVDGAAPNVEITATIDATASTSRPVERPMNFHLFSTDEVSI